MQIKLLSARVGRNEIRSPLIQLVAHQLTADEEGSVEHLLSPVCGVFKIHYHFYGRLQVTACGANLCGLGDAGGFLEVALNVVEKVLNDGVGCGLIHVCLLKWEDMDAPNVAEVH